MPLSVSDAALHTVHGYPGGATSLAPRLLPPKSATTLSHEVKPPEGGSAKLGLETAMQLMDLTGNTLIAQAVAARAGGMFVPMPSATVCNSEVFPALSRLAKEFGDVVAKVTDVAADGSISDNDLKEVVKEAGELMGALQGALQVLTDMHAARG